jgi:hypothetical protein
MAILLLIAKRTAQRRIDENLPALSSYFAFPHFQVISNHQNLQKKIKRKQNNRNP